MAEAQISNRVGNYLKLTGGELSGSLTTHGIKISQNIDYGSVLPSSGTEGQLFFQISEPYYELPDGGTANQILVKNSNNNRDVKWGDSIDSFVKKSGDTMTGALYVDMSTTGSRINLFQDGVTIGYWRLQTAGTASEEGSSQIVVGNNKNSTTDKNATGKIYLYNSNGSGCQFQGSYGLLGSTNRDHILFTYIKATQLWGAVWNDYAEFRKDNPNEKQKPGQCIRENGDGTLSLTTKRLEYGCEIISDTYGFAIGQDDKNGYNTPVASSGRVLAYPYESIDEFKHSIGMPVCSGPNGTVSIMSEAEERLYPGCIIGTISEIPSYEEWGTGKVKVNGRIWIRVR